MKIAIIGTSNITNNHIEAFGRFKKNILSISSTRKKSKNLNKFREKFKIKNIYFDWRKGIKEACKVKDSVFFITSRVKDNKKILQECCKTKKKIFIEKPVFIKNKDFKVFERFNNQIFVGYNRIYYNGIQKLKNKIDINNVSNIIVKCPEENKFQILNNSCHIISILFFLFGDLRLEKKIKIKNSIQCILTNKNKIKIYIFFNLKNSSNFSIEIYEQLKKYEINPIEITTGYLGIKKKKMKKGIIYIPKINFKYDEYKLSSRKPGFEKQFFSFRQFVRGKKIFNNLSLAKRITKLTNAIIN